MKGVNAKWPRFLRHGAILRNVEFNQGQKKKVKKIFRKKNPGLICGETAGSGTPVTTVKSNF